MKAYYVEIRDDPDQGGHIVWSTTARKARNDTGDLVYDRWIDVKATRSPHFDGMEGLSKEQLALEQWKEGWWFDSDEPTFDDYEENTDEDFLAWYRKRHNV